jgi:hypothetical protein
VTHAGTHATATAAFSSGKRELPVQGHLGLTWRITQEDRRLLLGDPRGEAMRSPFEMGPPDEIHQMSVVQGVTRVAKPVTWLAVATPSGSVDSSEPACGPCA